MASLSWQLVSYCSCLLDPRSIHGRATLKASDGYHPSEAVSPCTHTHTHSTVFTASDTRVDKKSSKMPYVVNGVTFDLSSPTHVIRLPQKKPPNVTLRDRLVAMATEGCSHKEVERRRKLKISSAIQELASSLPYKTIGRVVSPGLSCDCHVTPPPPTESWRCTGECYRSHQETTGGEC